MANGILGNSKNTLILAGGVLVCAAIAAATLGSQFIPNSELDYRETREVAQEPGASEGSTNAAAAQTTTQLADGSLNGFADDSELIDDTSGIDTTPATAGEVIVPSGNSGNNGFAEAETIEKPRRNAAAQPSVFQDYNPNAGRAPKPPKDDPLPRDPPPGQPFPKDRKIIELVEPGGG
jgi:multidrug efflux pump subunit AcrB